MDLLILGLGLGRNSGNFREGRFGSDSLFNHFNLSLFEKVIGRQQAIRLKGLVFFSLCLLVSAVLLNRQH